jgi:histidyl-tRNA synthetase
VIKPRTLKGFPDFLPAAMIPRERLIATAAEVYRSFGFAPISTPALEYTEILLGKGGEESDRLMYRFEDHGGRDVALRFDLTVPLARFVAEHQNELGMPFKRYHIAPVWRGENTQAGRYREFYQCDFDTIGTESVVADTETGVVIHELMRRIGFERFTIRVNDRRVLQGMLRRLGLEGSATVPVLRALDKILKIGADAVVAEMVREAGTTEAQARAVLKITELPPGGDFDADRRKLDGLRELVDDEIGATGLDSLAALREGLRAADVPDANIDLDPSIARGLDYYTGTVFETFLGDLPEIGSVCSGGRYDDLASLYTKTRLPGIGASLGLDRLLAAMDKLSMLGGRAATGDVLVVFFQKTRGPDYIALAHRLRRSGLSVELYPDPKKLAKQLEYADRRGHPLCVIVGENEWESRVAQVKVMATKETLEVPFDDLAATLRTRLAAG